MKTQSLPFNIALTGIVLATIIHLATYFGYLTPIFPVVVILLIGIFYPFFMAIRQEQRYHKSIAKGKPERGNIKKAISEVRAKQKADLKRYGQKPKVLIFLIIVITAYVFINFFWTAFSDLGSVEIENGQYILKNHGEIVRTLTEDEYLFQEAMQVRMMTGHPMLFYMISLFILYKEPADSNKTNYSTI